MSDQTTITHTLTVERDPQAYRVPGRAGDHCWRLSAVDAEGQCTGDVASGWGTTREWAYGDGTRHAESIGLRVAWFDMANGVEFTGDAERGARS